MIALVLAIMFTDPVFVRADSAKPLLAGVGKVDITNLDAGPVNDRLYARALVIKSDSATVAIVSVDAVAIGEIGYIKNDFLPKVRGRIEKELSIPPTNVVINASHCHGIVCADVDARTTSRPAARTLPR